MDDQASCYFRQSGGKYLPCSAPFCTRTDAEGKVKRMMGDSHQGSWHCPFHWRQACWRDAQRQCFCSRGCGHLAQEAAAQPLPTWWEENPRSGAAGPSASPAPHVPGLAHVPGPAHPTSQHVSSCQVEVVSCSRVLQAASQAPVANVEVVSHVLQCALDVATRLRHAVSALESLNTEEARVLAYGSHVGGWAVENSDLDLVVVLYADFDNDTQEKAFIRAFLSLYFLEACAMDGAMQVQDLVVEKDTVSYWQRVHLAPAGERLALKFDISAECCRLHQTFRPPSKVRLTEAVGYLLRCSKADVAGYDVAKVVIAWAKAACHCHDGNGVRNTQRLRSAHWAMLVAWTLHAYTDLAAKELPEIVAHMFVAICDMPFSTHVLCLNTDGVRPVLDWKLRDVIPGYYALTTAEKHAQFWLSQTDEGTRYAWMNMAKKVHYHSGEQSLFQALHNASISELF